MSTCTECDSQMIRKKRSEKAKLKKDQKYFFTEWDFCPRCFFVQHYEEHKVIIQD